MANKNRRKGHNAERHYASIFRDDLGFELCKTARYGSRLHDDTGIDLINIPFNIQIKAGYERGINYQKVLENIKDNIIKNFPPDSPERNNPSLIIHRKDVGRGKKRTELDDLVILSFEDLVKIIHYAIQSKSDTQTDNV